jgi:hypothetical protein
MPFIVEDGTGVADANSYASVEAADAYFVDRGNATWAALTEPQKQQALIKATDYLDRKYESRWRGTRALESQVLGWPRQYASYFGNWRRPILPNIVPPPLIQACAELAVRAASAELLPDIEAGANIVKREKVGPLEVEYAESSATAALPVYNAVADILQPLLQRGAAVAGVVRA